MRINHSTLLEPGGCSEFLSSEIRPSSGNAPGVMLPGCSQGRWGALCLTHCEALAPGGAGRGLQLSLSGFQALRKVSVPGTSPSGLLGDPASPTSAPTDFPACSFLKNGYLPLLVCWAINMGVLGNCARGFPEKCFGAKWEERELCAAL